jgi:hypothetical protein
VRIAKAEDVQTRKPYSTRDAVAVFR